MADDFAELESYLAAQIERLGPGQRRRIGRKIGQELRKANAKRIAANVQPDGAAMEPRKKRAARKGAKAARKGRMFRKLRLAKAMKIRAGADEVELSFEGAAGRTARAHQLGLVDFVGRTRGGKVVRSKYPERQLLGFGAEDLAMVGDAVLGLLES